ncbi:MAG TPA: hypothetical protein VIC55_06270 [Gemmatimonadaceae bacterium]
MIAVCLVLLAMPHAVVSQRVPVAVQDGALSRTSMGVLVRPESVTVGQPFTVVLRVQAPLGSVIGFPAGPDSGLSVEAVDPRTVRVTGDPSMVERTATYRLVAWDTGAQSSHLGDVVVTLDGRALRYHVLGDTVRVRSVLPADSVRRVPKPARDVMVARWPWWVWALIGTAAAALLWLLLWWWRRRARRRRLPTPLDAIATARRDFARVDALGLLEAGERGRHVALDADVLRDYLAARVPAALRSLTSTELLATVHGEPAIPAARIAPLLAETDLIKFAHRPVPAPRAAELSRETRALVEDIEHAILEQAAIARAAEKAA